MRGDLDFAASDEVAALRARHPESQAHRGVRNSSGVADMYRTRVRASMYNSADVLEVGCVGERGRVEDGKSIARVRMRP